MQMDGTFDWHDVAGIGLYTVPLVARLLDEKQRTVRSWIDGFSHSDAEPIIVRQIPRIGNKTVFGFLDLVEARFIKHFRDLGLSPQLIRKVARKLREKHDEQHPFATENRFRTDGKRIFLEVVETEEERKVLDVITDNFVMAPVIDQSLFETILYADDLAYRWRPVQELPSIVLDPKVAFGRPVIEGCWIPTSTLYSSFKVENDPESVADEFGIEPDAVEQAVRFERLLVEHRVH